MELIRHVECEKLYDWLRHPDQTMIVGTDAVALKSLQYAFACS
jgi:hypothetical protein